jgi:para-nitrobenzyl esterase
VFGESAGAAATLQLLTIPDAQGLVDKAIVQSGVGWWAPWNLSQMERMGVLMAAKAGLSGTEATAEQLRALPPDALPQLGVYSIDGRMQPENATTAIDEGRMADVPLLIGSTNFDGSSLRGRNADSVLARASDELLAAYASDDLSGADLGYQMYTDEHASAPARWIAREASNGAASYLYLFSYVLNENRGKVRGAAHGDDMWFLFDAWEFVNPQLQLTEEDRAAARALRSCWVSFAKTGAPRCDGAPNWPRYTPEGDQLMELGVSPVVRQNFRRRQLDAQEEAWRAGGEEAARQVEDAIRSFEESQL